MKSNDEITYDIFELWMIGGSYAGQSYEGFNSFSEYIDSLKTSADIIECIITILSECGEIFKVGDCTYDFTNYHPSAECSARLISAILLRKQEKEL